MQKTVLLNSDDLAADASLASDLGVTSLDRFDLVMGIEDEFGIELTAQEQETIKTVGDLVEQVKSHCRCASVAYL